MNTKKGDEIAAVVLQVDAERERISLGVKQLAEDPFNNWVALNKKGAIVTGKVTAVDAKGATVELADGVKVTCVLLKHPVTALKMRLWF